MVGTISYSFSYLLWKIRPADAVKQDSSPLHPLSEVVWDQHIDFFFSVGSLISPGVMDWNRLVSPLEVLLVGIVGCGCFMVFR